VTEAPTEAPEEVEDIAGETYTPWQLLQAGGVALCECDTYEEAEFVCFILGEQDVYSVVRQNLGTTDLRLPQVLIAPDHMEKARRVLSSADTTALRPQFEAESAIASKDFVPPNCPRCSSEELLLESVDPTNTWVCERCGTTWQDPPVESIPPA